MKNPSEQSHAVLLIESGIENARFFPLSIGATVIGKSDACDIVVSNPFVSRLHARITSVGPHFEIEDLGSKNGTYVNGSRVVSRQRLFERDTIELVPGLVVLRFQEADSTLTFDPTPPENANGILVVDGGSREVLLGNQKLEPPLTKKEFDVLQFLYRRVGRVCSKDEIAMWGWPERHRGDVADQDIEQYIMRLRKRLEDDPSCPTLITTVRGSGYKLVLGD